MSENEINSVTITSDKTGSTTTTYPALDFLKANPINSSTRTITTSNGLTYTVTTNNYTALGLPIGSTYDVKIVNSSGSIVLNDNNINRGINIANIIQIGATGDVISGSSDSSVLLNLASIGTYVSLPGSTGNFTIGVGGATANTYYIGGTTSIQGLANLITGSTINIIGGSANLTGNTGSILADVLSGSTINIEYGGVFDTSQALASVITESTINFGSGGGTLVVNGGGTLINLGTKSINNYDPSKDTIEFQGTENPVYSYTISGNGSSRTITLYDVSGKEIGNYTANISSSTQLNTGTYYVSDPANPLKITYNSGNTYIGACFLSGSLISAPSGRVTVESLMVGDEITAYIDGIETSRRVTWAGQAHCTVRPRLPLDQAGYPVRVLKDAIAEGVPFKDLLITAEHCLFFEGKFVPARMLVNGRSIFYDTSITSYDYYHIETENHSVIMADGMLTESYLDTGNRRSFTQKGSVLSIGGSRALTWDDAAAPLTVSREAVEPIFREVEARAEQNSCPVQSEAQPLTYNRDLRLVTDNSTTICQIRENNGRVMFMIPPGVKSVWIVSNASRPCDVVGPFVDDRRPLGVLVGDVRLFEGNTTTSLTAHLQDETLSGWNNVEDGTMRWTNGNALLNLGQRPLGSIALMSIQIHAAGPYLLIDTVPEQAALQA